MCVDLDASVYVCVIVSVGAERSRMCRLEKVRGKIVSRMQRVVLVLAFTSKCFKKSKEKGIFLCDLWLMEDKY